MCVFDSEIVLNKDSLLLFLSFSEVKLSLASFLSDRIVDEILEALSSSQNTLVRNSELWRLSAFFPVLTWPRPVLIYLFLNSLNFNEVFIVYGYLYSYTQHCGILCKQMIKISGGLHVVSNGIIACSKWCQRKNKFMVVFIVLNSPCESGGAPGEKRTPPGAARVPGHGCPGGQNLQTEHHGAAGGREAGRTWDLHGEYLVAPGFGPEAQGHGV